MITVSDARERLENGQIIAYPTETFYGLGVSALNEEALDALSRVKNRPAGKPFPVLLSSPELLKQYTTEKSQTVTKLIDLYWPGALTIVLPAKNLPSSLLSDSGKVGFRISAHPVASEIAKAFGQPFTTTSANLSNTPPLQDPRDVEKAFDQALVGVVDGGMSPGGLPSTVIELVAENEIKVLREGAIQSKEITEKLKEAA